MVTTLVIAVVKSSLALSLGLVGALSIVRFRTPVKEPEELTYLFFSIALGLAGCRTIYSSFCWNNSRIFGHFCKYKLRKRGKLRSNNNLKILIDDINTVDIDRFISVVKDHVEAIDFTNLIMKIVIIQISYLWY